MYVLQFESVVTFLEILRFIVQEASVNCHRAEEMVSHKAVSVLDGGFVLVISFVCLSVVCDSGKLV